MRIEREGKTKYFEVSERELVVNRQPLDSWEVAHLFYGVPRWAKYAMRKVTGGILFSNKPL